MKILVTSKIDFDVACERIRIGEQFGDIENTHNPTRAMLHALLDLFVKGEFDACVTMVEAWHRAQREYIHAKMWDVIWGHRNENGTYRAFSVANTRDLATMLNLDAYPEKDWDRYISDTVYEESGCGVRIKHDARGVELFAWVDEVQIGPHGLTYPFLEHAFDEVVARLEIEAARIRDDARRELPSF